MSGVGGSGSRFPRHLAVIGDGNRRWAESRGLPGPEGHLAAVAAVDKLVEDWRARAPEGAHLTFWWSSIDNLQRRDPAELAVLFAAYRLFFDAFDATKLGVELRAYGRWEELLPAETAAAVRGAIARSQPAPRVLSFLLAYNGDAEMLAAIDALRSLAPRTVPVSDSLLRRYLTTGALPPIDLIVRTGGDAHLSNGFMMWHTQNAQLWFSDRLWPEFNEVELDHALAAYAAARRRFGA